MKDALKILLFTVGIVVALSICCFLTSCGSEKLIYVPGPSVHDTVVEHSILSDTVVRKDSVYVERYVKGDTVFVEKSKEHYEYNGKFRVDTVYKSRTDTLTITNVVEVEKELNSYDKVALASGRWLLPLFILLLVVGAVVAYFKLRTKGLRKITG